MSILKENLHPGEILKTLYLEPMGMSAIALASKLGVPRTRIERLVKQETALTTDTALRLAKYFRTTAEYWINMQTYYDLSKAASMIDLSQIEPMAMPAE